MINLDELTPKEKANELTSLLDRYFSADDVLSIDERLEIENDIYSIFSNVADKYVEYTESHPHEEHWGSPDLLYAFIDYDYSLIVTQDEFNEMIDFVKTLPVSLSGIDFNE